MQETEIDDPYTNKPIFYKYDSGDRQLLIDLLNEYSDKLAGIYLDIESKYHKKKICYCLSAFKFAYILAALLLAKINITSLIILMLLILNLSLINGLDSSYVGMAIGIFMISLILLILSIELISNLMMNEVYQQKINLLKKEGTRIAMNLEKVMRVTIEIQDAVEVNLARKLELDLRIADAESALSYYHSLEKLK